MNTYASRAKDCPKHLQLGRIVLFVIVEETQWNSVTFFS